MSTLNELNLALKMKRKYGLTTFVETGCDEGYGIAYAKAIGFSPVYTCDIDEKRCARSFPLIDPRKGDIIFFGTSEDFLHSVLPQLNGERCLFWLDAHFPEEFGLPGAAPRWPLPRELDILAGKKGIENDVILCDDMHCIKDPLNDTFNPAVQEDRQQEGTIAELTAKLPLAASLLGIGNGILVLEPR